MKGANTILYIFDVTSGSCFKNLEDHMEAANEFLEPDSAIPKILVGIKGKQGRKIKRKNQNRS